MGNIKLMERDYVILKEIERWRVLLGRHICHIAGFSGQRACDRRLRKLIENGFLDREKVIYGIPSIYSLTPAGKALIGKQNRKEKIRIEQITHDITVADVAIYFNQIYNIPFNDILTEKQLHQMDGFSNRIHRPDFVFKIDDNEYCAEIELSMKSKSRFEKNIISNFNNYHKQIWVVPDTNNQIFSFLLKMSDYYPNIEIIEVAEVKENEYKSSILSE